MDIYFYVYIGLINAAAFIISGLDKSAAIKRRWRVPESTLFIVAAAGGSIGMYASMLIFRHKTKHMRFMIGIPVIFVIQVIFIYSVLFR